MKVGMSSHHSHAVVRHCEHTQVKIHTVAELLLLSGQFRPIKTENTNGVKISLASAKEQINSSLSIVMEIVTDITKMMSDMKSRWKVMCDMLYRLSDAVTVLIELCYFVSFQYLGAGKSSTEDVLVDKYAASYAGLEIRLSCVQLKRARLDELTATFIMDICSNISKYISVLTDNCRGASESASDTATRDQFKLGIKSVTCAAGSLIASIKSYKSDRSARHHSRVVTFCEPVLAASHALVCLATEEEFVDRGLDLTHDEQEIQKSVFGPCMNIVSGCVQMCKTLRDFAHDTNNTHYLHKAKSCQHSVAKSTGLLKHALQNHLKMDFHIRSASPIRGDNRYQPQSEESEALHELHRESSPFDRKSPQPTESHRDLSPFNRSSPQELSRDLSPFNRSSPQELPRDLSPFRSSPQPLENHGRNDLSPRSTVASSDISFTNSSVSR
ncbi:LOW QUALITY PROTEIN: talin rod domain-containing protein 1-like [Ruditapes philippinarum]|uniref:LOW QUALITY PROTEIN: talin rod domain-containing protein 1-like n=1 Tax=Ruditapes philippinarum TaxID=129788 RepID=UPI00295BF8B0|nr:LOW QUALITY PROTEIN: talin rod domain-containing protein 1-like [Ruditapes philippinarum]